MKILLFVVFAVMVGLVVSIIYELTHFTGRPE